MWREKQTPLPFIPANWAQIVKPLHKCVALIHHSFVFFPLQEQIQAYKEKMKAINARAPKKVIEAKARKKRKVGEASQAKDADIRFGLLETFLIFCDWCC